MLLEQQVSPLSRFKRLWQSGIQDFPRGAVIGGVISAWFACEEACRDLDERGRHGRDRCQLGKEQNLLRAGLPNHRKSLEQLLRGLETLFGLVLAFAQPLFQSGGEISAKFVLYFAGDFLQSIRAYCGRDYACPHQLCKLRL